MPSGESREERRADRHEKSDKVEKSERGDKERDRDTKEKSSSKADKDRDHEKEKDRDSHREKEREKDKDKDREKEREKDRDKDREREKDRSERKSSTTSTGGNTSGTTADAKSKTSANAKPVSSTPAKPATAAPTPAKTAPVKPGLTEETLAQVAQAKFEAQEDKLRDVARNMMALLRDYPKLGGPEVTKKVAEIRKCLMKYEMQYLRVSELQEKRRRVEIGNLEAEAARCRQEAEVEASKLPGLHETLDLERRRRKRYEGYEEFAAEVNKKKTRTEYHAEIERVNADIADIRSQRKALEEKIDQRIRRAQLLRGAAAELAADLREEQEAAGAVLNTRDEDEPAESPSPSVAPPSAPAPARVVEVIT
eukprot:TRINITY_DN121538_c0_g1_i1.p1 TRINITY_DN121538_c0_g1~~TRINITY_DN121538_c0_g1_i1.p1  ORF type:complete len:414 (-),score=110.92 TRINITY_DN121538_c0_g1_i1:100-1200(-)